MLKLLREIRDDSAATKQSINDLMVSCATYAERTDNLEDRIDDVEDDIDDHVKPLLDCCVKFKSNVYILSKAFLALGGGTAVMFVASKIL